MSDKHDHSHSGHDHHHHHGHDHDHDHDHGDTLTETLDRPEVSEDAGSQALSEALSSSFAIIKVIMIGLVLVFLGSGFFTVGTQEKAIILRFGKPVGQDEKALLGPGPHWAFPYPIDEVVRIPMGQLQTVSATVGWYATTPAMEAAGTELPPGPTLNPAIDSYVLTADGNIMHVRGTLLYRITEPGIRYIFDFVNASNLVQNAFNNALIFASASYKVDDALTRDFAGFRDRVQTRLNQLIVEQKLGITVDQMTLRPVPPRFLKTAFDAVIEAGVRSSKTINDARSYENQTVSRAKAEAEARINTGEIERTRMVEFVKAEANRFTDLLPAYRLNPRLFMQQRQTEAMQRILNNVQDKMVLPTGQDGNAWKVRLQLNREPLKPKAAEPMPGDH